MIPQSVQLGRLTLHTYGLFIAVGMVLGLQVVQYLVAKEKLRITSEQISTLVIVGILGGLVGARLYHVIDAWEYYARHNDQIWLVWQGGLGIYGGMVGALAVLLLFLWLQAKRTQTSAVTTALSRFLLVVDLAAIGMPLGQAIGRWGNWVNQELYGLPTQLPWAVYIEERFRLPGYEAYSHFHPLFAYESAWSLIIFLLLYGVVYKRYRIPFGSGVYVASYLAMYALGRFWLEFLRLDPWRIGWLTTAQWISVGIMILTTAFFYRKRRRLGDSVR